MLTHLRIKNFKAWQDTGPIRLAPLTVIFGTNSSGKSSLGHLLLALKQTVLSTDRKRPLHLGDSNTLVDLGTFADCLHNHDENAQLEIEIGWNLPHGIDVVDPTSPRDPISGDALFLKVKLESGRGSQPEVSFLEYILKKRDEPVLTVTFSRNQKGIWELNADNYNFKMALGRKWPLEAPEKFYRLSDVTLARFQNASFLADFALEMEFVLGEISYLGPLRSHPQRIYQWSGDTPSSVGQMGEATIAALLAAQDDQRFLNRGPKQGKRRFEEFIAAWLRDLGVIQDFQVRPVAQGRKEYEVVVRTHRSAPPVKITDVGFGVSQVLPALVQAFYAQPNSTVWMEQPEIHLHPQVQAELADAFISAIQSRQDGKDRKVQLIIESHSEHFLNRLQRRVAEEKADPADIAIYFAKRNVAKVNLEELEMNEFGEISNWPDNFFGDEMADISGRTIAAMQRMKKRKA
jgi:predicted ATPase